MSVSTPHKARRWWLYDGGMYDRLFATFGQLQDQIFKVQSIRRYAQVLAVVAVVLPPCLELHLGCSYLSTLSSPAESDYRLFKTGKKSMMCEC